MVLKLFVYLYKPQFLIIFIQVCIYEKKSYWLPHPTGREVMIGGGKEGIGSDWSVSNFYELKKTSRLHSIIINAKYLL